MRALAGYAAHVREVFLNDTLAMLETQPDACLEAAARGAVDFGQLADARLHLRHGAVESGRFRESESVARE